jgi:hypothetical protein
LIFINDLTDEVENHVDLFADDTTLYRYLQSNTRQNVLKDLEQLNLGHRMGGFVQCQKTQVMTISRKKQEIKDPKFLFLDTELTETDRSKFLGVTITSTLNWSKHIDGIKAKAGKKMGILRRGKLFLPKSALTILYKSCVRSSLEYAVHQYGKELQNLI